MRAGTWATVVAILIMVAVGWWVVNWEREDTVPMAEMPAPTTDYTPPVQQEGQTPAAEPAPQTTEPEQTVGEPTPQPEPRPAD